MSEPGLTVDVVRLESRLTTIETKLSDTALRERVGTLEQEAKDAHGALARVEVHLKHLPTEKEFSDLMQRLARLETRVAHLPSKGFIVTVITAMGAVVALATSLDKLKTLMGL